MKKFSGVSTVNGGHYETSPSGVRSGSPDAHERTPPTNSERAAVIIHARVVARRNTCPGRTDKVHAFLPRKLANTLKSTRNTLYARPGTASASDDATLSDRT